MTNTYRALSDRGRALYGDAVFEHEFTAVDERDALDAGHIELAPRTYRQLSNNYSAAEQGETFEGAFPVEIEAALIDGGHIERVDPDEVPAGNATRDEWADYARRHGASEEDLLDDDGKPLGRNELRDKYGAIDPTNQEEE